MIVHLFLPNSIGHTVIVVPFLCFCIRVSLVFLNLYCTVVLAITSGSNALIGLQNVLRNIPLFYAFRIEQSNTPFCGNTWLSCVRVILPRLHEICILPWMVHNLPWSPRGGCKNCIFSEKSELLEFLQWKPWMVVLRKCTSFFRRFFIDAFLQYGLEKGSVIIQLQQSSLYSSAASVKEMFRTHYVPWEQSFIIFASNVRVTFTSLLTNNKLQER